MLKKEYIEVARSSSIIDLCNKLAIPIIKVTSNEWQLVEHDSLRISPTRGFYWHSLDFGGNAIDFLTKVYNYTFEEAVKTILSKDENELISFPSELQTPLPEPDKRQPLVLPEKAINAKRVIAYLVKERKIDYEIVIYCLKNNLIYQDNNGNAVFVGYSHGKPAHAALRGTVKDKRFAGDVKGSDKNYGFSISLANTDVVHVFESPIDLLSYLTIQKLKGKKSRDTYLTLAGVSLRAFNTYITNRRVFKCVCHTDNDDKGESCARSLEQLCKDRGIQFVRSRPKGKDVNDDLKAISEKSCTNNKDKKLDL